MNTRYAYSVGKLRVLESKMLSETKIERMLEALNIQDIFRELEWTEYTEGAAVKDEEMLEDILNYQLSKVYELVISLSMNPEITNLFLISNDIDNLKLFLKAKLTGIEHKTTVFNKGLFTAEAVKQMVDNNSYKQLPEIINKAAKTAVAEFEETSDSQIIDILLDKAKYDYFFEVLAIYKNEFLIKLIKVKIDLANIKTFIRLKIREKDKNFLQKLFISHGLLSERIFSDLFDSPLETLVKKLQFTDYGKIVSKAVGEYKKSNKLTGLEKIFDDYFISFLRRAKYIVFGIEPLIAYLFAKEYEIKNIRTIILSKLNQVPNDMVKERLSQTYV